MVFLIEKYIALTSPQANFKNLKAWGSEELRNHRNRLSHKLGGISEGELYQAWGKDTYNQKDWENFRKTVYVFASTTMNAIEILQKKQFIQPANSVIRDFSFKEINEISFLHQERW